jgi:hypothetical protein
MANMLKKIKKGQRKKPPAITENVAHSWLDDDGFHFFGPGNPPTAEEYDEMTRIYREKIRSSPLWTAMVKQYGMKKAEEILLECKVKPG